ncbi:hypothetical protein NC797_08740 [Aquibacillus sp. 3ASR75-11]|uniref:Uncharacterized protein n=1 Tax=Terrihalobacillus insolitus TaxID=2950438 RepID=A0A9X3WRU4_9BACI|nr:hypothetical protein [Terrihalobacillus insolitus]MDC3413868.1 hypothetical protein [Terrihalobacillus insolitus]MDC3424595.1 hypothetical protein [Terrihalobacillus insolitus]
MVYLPQHLLTKEYRWEMVNSFLYNEFIQLQFISNLIDRHQMLEIQ